MSIYIHTHIYIYKCILIPSYPRVSGSRGRLNGFISKIWGMHSPYARCLHLGYAKSKKNVIGVSNIILTYKLAT